MKQTVIFLALLLSFGQLSAQRIDPLIQDFKRIFEKADFQGSLLISQNGQTLLELTKGFANTQESKSNEIDTKYVYASMGKMFTGVAILQLVEKGKISLEDKLIDIIPNYPNKDVAEKVTVHQLLTHTAGITPLFQMTSDHWLSANSDFLPLFVNEPLMFEPGQQMSYSNAGYIILGLIIEEVTGQSYRDYLEYHILEPSGMNETGLILGEAGDKLAIHYTNWLTMGEGPKTDMDYGHDGNPAGGGYSTVGDFDRFGQALLSGKLLSDKYLDMLLTGYAEGRSRGKYGYGFYIADINGLDSFGHGGGAPGVNGEFIVYPDQGIIVSVLTNTDPHGATFIKDAFTGLLLQYSGMMPETEMNGTTEFRLEGFQDAKFVTVQSAFTEGNMFKYPLEKKDGGWLTRINIPEGRHLYRFIVDGTSYGDPLNPKTMRAQGGIEVSEIIVK